MLDEIESDFDKGMRARLVDYKFNYLIGCIVLDLDLNGLEEHNKRYEQPTYYDNNGFPTLQWHETIFYPKSGKSQMYCDLSAPLPFKLVTP